MNMGPFRQALLQRLGLIPWSPLILPLAMLGFYQGMGVSTCLDPSEACLGGWGDGGRGFPSY